MRAYGASNDVRFDHVKVVSEGYPVSSTAGGSQFLNIFQATLNLKESNLPDICHISGVEVDYNGSKAAMPIDLSFTKDDSLGYAESMPYI